MRRSYIISLVATVVITAAAVIGAAAAGWAPVLGLDLQGGIAVTYQASEVTDEANLDQAVAIIRQRVDALGVAEPDITRQGETIVVELPGVDDPQRALDLIGQTAELRFRPVVLGPIDPNNAEARAGLESALVTVQGLIDDAAGPTEPADATTTTVADDASTTTVADDVTTTTVADDVTTTTVADTDVTTTTVADTDASTTTVADDASTTTAPDTTTTTVFDESTAPTLDELITQPEQDDPEKAVILPSSDGTEIYLLGPSEASGVIVGDANATFTNEWFVSVEFTDEGSAVWDAIAQANLGRQLGIVLDGAVESAPTIQTTEFGGSARITGNFDQQRAEDLALVLRFGALPVELEPQTVQQVSATLGEDALQAGIIAGLIGLVLVSVYMLLNYRLLGVVAICSLLVSTGMLWFLISWLGETQGLALSLSGAVGIILSIGVAVDSNVVYYERIKEEIRRGRAPRSAAAGSFDDAFSTIVKADVASLIGAIILFTLTIGAVRGFALYLAIATVIDMLVSYVFMRPMVLWVVRTYASQDPKRLGVTLRPTEPPAAAQAEVMS